MPDVSVRQTHRAALHCTEPPKGRVQWVLRLLAARVAELDYIGSVFDETVRRG